MNESKPDINKIMFMHLVSMLAMSAIQQMGKLVDPATGKAAVNLDAAQATIDMLDMLLAKTINNLDAEEARLLKDTLSSLKMNFVETKDAEDRKPDASGQKSEVSDQGSEVKDQKADGDRKTDDERPTTEDGKRKAEEDKTPKYHKNYT
jgi:hypothetical protein